MPVMEITSKRSEAAHNRGTDASLVPEARGPADKASDDRVTDPSLLPKPGPPRSVPCESCRS
jgi:hypothetical protein